MIWIQALTYNQVQVDFSLRAVFSPQYGIREYYETMSECQLENSRNSFNKHVVCSCYGVAPPKLEVFAEVVYNTTSLHEYAT